MPIACPERTSRASLENELTGECDLLDAARSGGYTACFQSSKFASKRGRLRGC
jgi:hypothetical protein